MTMSTLCKTARHCLIPYSYSYEKSSLMNKNMAWLQFMTSRSRALYVAVVLLCCVSDHVHGQTAQHWRMIGTSPGYQCSVMWVN